MPTSTVIYEDAFVQIVRTTSDVDPASPGGWVTTTTIDKPGSPAANKTTVTQRAQTALGANATFLGLASPTNAQTLLQVQRLTKQCNGLILFLLNQFDDISNT